MRAGVVVSLTLAWACAAPSAPRSVPDGPDDDATDRERHFTIWLGGARVGDATETERWTRAGLTVARNERLEFLRGDTPVIVATEIVIDADRDLVPRRVSWTERGPTLRRTTAWRDRRGWRITRGMVDEALGVTSDAIPAELLPVVLRMRGRFEGPVFLPARGFVGGRGRVDAVAEARFVARLELATVTVEATIDVDRDGGFARIVDGEGVIAMRATAAEAAAPFPLVDVVGATAIPIGGARSSRIALDGDLALPPLPGQSARTHDGGIELVLSAALPGALPPREGGRDRTREIASVVTTVQRRIVPDLAATRASPRDAAAATSGDCTTYALAYAALATSRAIPTRVITGLRVDGDRLVRHRWAVSWTGSAWIAIDAAFGAVPAGGDLIGLAIHDADDAGLIAGEAALTRVRAAAWR